MRKPLQKTLSNIRSQVGEVRESLTGTTDAYLLTDIYRFAQKQHLAAPLFSLDEIAIEPRVLTPLVETPRSLELAPTDSVSLTIPYIPDWPELAAIYNASTMTLAEGLQGNANIVLAGHPGSGKTFGLAWLASNMARKAKGLGILIDLLPLYVHATDILNVLDSYSNKNETDQDRGVAKPEPVNHKQQIIWKYPIEPADILIRAISTYATPLTLPRLARILQNALANQKAILLLDRVDELPPARAQKIVAFIQQLLEKYPGVRIVIALSYENLLGLPVMGFRMLSMAAWGNAERSDLLQKWSHQWEKYGPTAEKDQTAKVDLRFLSSWLSAGNAVLNPLEYTLKVWAAFSGDILGADGPSAIESYIRRMTIQAKDSLKGLESFALQLLVEMDICANPHDAARTISEYAAKLPVETTPGVTEGNKEEKAAHEKPQQIKELGAAEVLAANGFLIAHPGARFGFSHAVILGYLAGRALSGSNLLTKVQAQPAWIGRNLAIFYFSLDGDVTAQIQYYLTDDDFIHTHHLLVARWLQIAPKNRPWRTIILRTLATSINKEKETLSLAAKIMTAMALSGDEGISLFFRQLLKSDHPNQRQLGALGCGILGDKSAVEELNNMLQEQST
ncbi:MAG: hypothetical protein ACM3H7_00065, partial [Acidobacteriaceae bacterium]